MEIDIIKSLKSNLADLTYILFIIGKEFELLIQNSEDDKVNDNLRQAISALQDSNSDVIRLYHELSTHEAEIQNEWYDDETSIKNLQHEVDNLSKSIDVILKANRSLLNINE